MEKELSKDDLVLMKAKVNDFVLVIVIPFSVILTLSKGVF